MIALYAPPVFPTSATAFETGMVFTEGPVWVRGEWIWSDIPANTLYAKRPGEAKRVFRQPTMNTNGNTLDRQGRLISCRHSGRDVIRTEKDGTIVVLASTYEGKKLNSPNDVVVAKDGTIFFTDPPYGIPSGEKQEVPFFGVWRLTPDGVLTPIRKDLKKPNGIALSPNGKTLYVADTEGVVNVMTLDGKALRTFGTVGSGWDGMRVDVRGYLYLSARDGIRIHRPDGSFIALIPTPRSATNCAFGGRDGRDLLITSGDTVHLARTPFPGLIR